MSGCPHAPLKLELAMMRAAIWLGGWVFGVVRGTWL